MADTSVFGNMLQRVYQARVHTYKQAEKGLWERNKIVDRTNYKMAETTTVLKDGSEIKEFRLYKLIDASVVTISAEVNTEILLGSKHLTENRRGKSSTN